MPHYAEDRIKRPRERKRETRVPRVRAAHGPRITWQNLLADCGNSALSSGTVARFQAGERVLTRADIDFHVAKGEYNRKYKWTLFLIRDWEWTKEKEKNAREGARFFYRVQHLYPVDVWNTRKNTDTYIIPCPFRSRLQTQDISEWFYRIQIGQLRRTSRIIHAIRSRINVSDPFDPYD